ncbi:hypothetical protein AB6896_01885 [Rahnella inusitata]|uniref:hypothetical protein n=1 Tax=Rahnella inusitata TaxID=58169 RepID=UPI0039BE4AE8
MKKLSELPDYVRAELIDFLSQPMYMTGSESLLIEHEGVQVSLRFERDEDEFMSAKPMFEVGHE